MIATICKEFTFDAAHRLDLLPTTHKCHHMHGHTYRVRLYLCGPVDGAAMVVDYDVLDEMVIAPIHRLVDHRVLNDVNGVGHPTTENLARWFFNLATRQLSYLPEDGHPRPKLTKIRVYESSTTFAEYIA